MAPWGLHALYTSGDGNCLLHSALLGCLGVRDTRVPQPHEPGASSEDEILAANGPRRTLRAALHYCLLHCVALRQLLAAHGAALEPAAAGVDTLESRSGRHGSSCDPGHVLLLAHVLARPIVCYANAAVGEVREVDPPRTMSSYAAKGERMSGVYLPCLLDPSECSRTPLALVYTQVSFFARSPP